MIKCGACNRVLRRDELVSAVFAPGLDRAFFHKECEEGVDQFAKWRDEVPWSFKPTRLSVAEWKRCSPRKHLGVWQSMFIARRDEDVNCPDCGLKIARHENLTCPACTGQVVILAAEKTRMVFSHGEPLYKLYIQCVEKGDESNTYAVISGYTPVTVTAKRKGKGVQEQHREAMMLRYESKDTFKQGLTM